MATRVQSEAYYKRFTDIEPVRVHITLLVDHYGSMSLVAEATGISYRTLQGIMLPGKYERVLKSTATKIAEAVEHPTQQRPSPFSNKRYVKTEKVLPLVQFLVKTYGSVVRASEAVDIPANTLSSIMRGDRVGVKREIAAKLAEFVVKHRRPERGRFEEMYENEELPRYATEEDQKALQQAKRASRWRMTGS